MATQTLQFYTTGEGFTGLLESFFKEGRLKALWETLTDGGLPEEQIKLFFMGLAYFKGDTRKDGSLDFCLKEADESIEDRVYWCLRNVASDIKEKFWVDDEYDDEDGGYWSNRTITMTELFSEKHWNNNENIQHMLKVFTREQMLGWCLSRIMRDEGYTVNPDPSEYHPHGAILPSGEFIVCDYMQHKFLWPVLFQLGLTEQDDWMHDDDTLHVSSGHISGRLAMSMEDGERIGVTDAQINTIILYKNSIKKIYGGWEKMFETLRKRIGSIENHGGKWNNLMFLKQAYPTLNLPKFSKTYIEGVNNCLRTSPALSLPGLLESKFNLTEGENLAVIDEMKATFEKYKNVRKGNEFHCFFQEFIEGVNGVFHVSRSGFSYAIGDDRGDVVGGKTSNTKLKASIERKLKEIADMLHNDLDIPMQVEFVVTPTDKIYIVQLRKIENEVERTVISSIPDNIIVEGKTFSKGDLEDLTPDDVLLVREDADSEALLGKKALIVINNVEFSHILALSSALQIPSIFGTGDIELPNKFSMKAFNETGYIYKS